MLPFHYFNTDDKKVKDVCPVCKIPFGHSYIRIERVYLCEDCGWEVLFFPYETTPHMVKPGREPKDGWIEHKDFPGRAGDFPDIPQGPKLPPWWA